MSSTGIDQGAPAPPSRQTMRRVAFASFVGTAIEYYDFYIYGTAAALVFPKVFFPEQTPVIAALLSFATFGVAFFSRPVGAAIFGHFGDRIGRKRTLVATLLIMGFSTIAVGLIPPAAMIGVLAPILLVFFRFTQGFAVGGEWAGSALLSAEYAPPAKRGFYGMFTQLGVGAGLLLTNLIFLVVSTTIGEASDAFLSWGWRLPFLFSAVLVAVALYVRLNIEETPVFKKEKGQPLGVQGPAGRPVPQPAQAGAVRCGLHGRCLHLQLHGRHLSDWLCKPGVGASPLVGAARRCARRRRDADHDRDLGGHVRQARAAADHPARLRAGRAVVVRRDAAARHRVACVADPRHHGHLRHSRHHLRPDGLVHPRAVPHPGTATPAPAWRSTSPASSAVPCHRWSRPPC